jgi:prefoldin beta subunit
MSQEDISKKIHELQNLEQNLQSMMVQKQSVQMELNEALNATEELKNSSGDVFKIVSGMMIKSERVTLQKELDEKKKNFGPKNRFN